MGETPPDCGLLYHFTSSVDPSDGPGEGRLLEHRDGADGTVSADSDPRLSVPRLIDPLGERGFPIFDNRCWSYAFDESFTLRREKSRSPLSL
jgi:hypothetical protein